ncbi:MAG: response regulator [Clostridiales bacterium]|nr:response regulator [Clostridiales bacterium]
MTKILVADDEAIERTFVCRSLSKKLEGELQIFEAANGREAVAIFQREGIDVAILDVEMPGMNGIEAAEAIRAQDPDCSIIFLTAYDEFAYAKKAIAVRALDYLLKPYTDEELLTSVEEGISVTLEHRAVRRELARQAADTPQEPGETVAEARPQETEPVTEEEPAEENGLQEGDRLSVMRGKFRRYLSENYMREISLQEVAKDMNYSEAYFSRLFKQCFNQNFITYLTAWRVDEARKLLSDPRANVGEVGRAVGYSDPNYFAKVFKRVTGQSPSEYRQGFRNPGPV